MVNVKGLKNQDKCKVYYFDDIYILDAKRSAFGKFKGHYSKYSSTKIASELLIQIFKNLNLDPKKVDQLIFANTIPSSSDAIFLPRHIALNAGMEYNSLASMSQRICASSLESVILSSIDLGLGCSDFIVAGGVENMSRAPLAAFDIRNGFSLGASPFSDLLWDGLYDSFCKLTMGETAEHLAKIYSISRKEADEYTLLSTTRSISAFNKNLFVEEILPCLSLYNDETIRMDIDQDKLSSLKPSFLEDGVHTAASSSTIADGACALILSSSQNLMKPLGKVLSSCTCGVDPSIMGISPSIAIKYLLEANCLNTDDIDLFEINEAFAAQYLAVEKELKLDRSKVNVNGGALSIGHPLAATGARLITTILYELKRQSKKLGVVSACVGGGQGIAILIESTP